MGSVGNNNNNGTDCGGLGNKLLFKTSLGREVEFAATSAVLAAQIETAAANVNVPAATEGMTNSSNNTMALSAPSGEQIVGLRFRRGRLQGLDCIAAPEAPRGQLCVIFVAGWLATESDATESFRRSANRFFLKYAAPDSVVALRWESAHLLKLGSLLADTIRSYVGETAANLWVRATVASVSWSAASALVWPWYVLSSIKDLDNEWLVVKEKAKLAGQALAAAIVGRKGRPTILIGHSMGSRVIFYALQELHAQGQLHCVEHAVLLGAPCSPADEGWSLCRQVVSGRLVNGYIQQDWVLGALYRFMELRLSVAGLGCVLEVEGIENVDLSDLVTAHDEYPGKMAEILERLEIY